MESKMTCVVIALIPQTLFLVDSTLFLLSKYFV